MVVFIPMAGFGDRYIKAGFEKPKPLIDVDGKTMIARVVETFARRLQVQESLPAQIAHCIQDVLTPRGVGVVVEGVHQCMTTRGVRKAGVSMITSQLLGHFRSDPRTRAEFLSMIGNAGDRA